MKHPSGSLWVGDYDPWLVLGDGAWIALGDWKHIERNPGHWIYPEEWK